MLTTEQSRKLVDLRQRMLANVRDGRPDHEGISPDELREAIAWTRQNRQAGTSEGGKKGKKKNVSSGAPIDLASKWGDLD